MGRKPKIDRARAGRVALLAAVMAPLVYASVDQAWYWQRHDHGSQMVLRAAVLILASLIGASVVLGLGARLLRRPRASEAYLGLARGAARYALVAGVLGCLLYYLALMVGYPLSWMALEDPTIPPPLREDHLGYLGVNAAFRTGGGLLGAGLAWWLMRRERRAGAAAADDPTDPTEQ